MTRNILDSFFLSYKYSTHGNINLRTAIDEMLHYTVLLLVIAQRFWAGSVECDEATRRSTTDQPTYSTVPAYSWL